MILHSDDRSRFTIRAYAGEALVDERELRRRADASWDPDYWQPTAEVLPEHILRFLQILLNDDC